MATRALEIGPAGQHAAQAVARLREARGWSQSDLAARLAEAGSAISKSMLSKAEAGARRIDVDDLVVLAVALEVSVGALLPPQEKRDAATGAELFVITPGRRDDAPQDAGPVLAALAEDVEALGDLTGVEPTLAEIAYRLARQMDGVRPVPCDDCGSMVHIPADPRILPQLAKELRATVAALLEGRAPDDDDDDGFGDLGDV
ncbi:helix-turn-helix domain-containing protein [Streptomyces sp. NPDC051569]|uniref:helix-turn-helix domain-containing protein n=1 Tax=Streptomyces sp. NPDC051569 TaxID=3365661 RepID=UPI003796BFBF